MAGRATVAVHGAGADRHGRRGPLSVILGLAGGMRDAFPLPLTHIRRRMRTVHARSSVVTQVAADGTRIRASFADVAERADRLAAGLNALGVRPGARVGRCAGT